MTRRMANGSSVGHFFSTGAPRAARRHDHRDDGHRSQGDEVPSSETCRPIRSLTPFQ